MVNHLAQYFFEALFGIFLIFALLKAFGKLGKTKTQKDKRIPFFDFAKGTAIITVICAHATNLVPKYLELQDIFSYAVPIFVICSGYLLARRHNNKIDLKKYFSNIIFRIVIIYAIFTFAEHLWLRNGDIYLRLLLKDFFLGKDIYYFIPVIIQLYLLFPFIIKLKDKIKLPRSLISIFFFSLFFMNLDHFLQYPSWGANPYSLAFFGRYLIYFCFGMILSDFDLKKAGISRFYELVLIFILGLVLIPQFRNAINMTYFYPIIIFIFLMSIHKTIFAKMSVSSKIIEDLGKNSLVIYLLHGPFVMRYISHSEIYKTSSLVTNQPILAYILIILTILLSSYIFSKLFMLIYNPIIGKIREKLNL